MSETWYRALSMGGLAKIEPVTVERYNDKSVWVWRKRWGQPELRRHSRYNDLESFFPTFEFAKSHLFSHYSSKAATLLAAADYNHSICVTVSTMTAENITDTLEGRV